MWLDWLVFCEYGFSVFALWCPLATPTILLGFLLPWAWGISSQLLQQSAAIAPYRGQGVSPHHRPSWPSTWDSSSRPSCGRVAMAPMCVHIYTHTHTHICFHVLFHYDLPQDIEYSSLCYTRPCCLSVLYTVVCNCWSPTPDQHPHPLSLFFVSLLLFHRWVHLCRILDSM